MARTASSNQKTEEILSSIFKILHACNKSSQAKRKPSRDLTIIQLRILFYLSRKGRTTMKELAEKFSVAPASMTDLIDRLVTKKLIKRTAEKKDKRVTEIEVSDFGKKKLAKIMKHRSEIILRLFGTLSGSEQNQLLKIFNKLIGNLPRVHPSA
jgi:DNA-binding MarR family transcriptional regulator